jgi:sarcosine oxidase subunit beta
MSPPSVVVVGAGSIGLAAALRAAELGCPVTVLEKQLPASGSSGLSAGIFSRQAADPLDVEIRVRAERFLTTLELENALPLAREGYVRVAHTADQMDQLARTLALEQELGVEDARLLDRAGLGELVPDLRCDGFEGGLYGARDGHLDGHLLCSVLVDRGRALGVDYRFHTELLGTREARSGVHRLVTDSGDVACDVVVNAAGAWASHVGELLEAPAPLVPQRHQVCVVALPGALPYTMPTVQTYFPGSGAFALYLRAEGSEQLLAGLHTHEILEDKAGEDPDAFRRTLDAEYAELVAERLTELLPTLAGLRLRGGYAGLYPISTDGRPQIGPYADRPGVIAACGGGGVGLTGGLVYGQIAAEWAACGEPRTIPGAAAYVPDRDSLAVIAPSRCRGS